MVSIGLSASALNNTLGVAFLGHFTTAILYGITSLQTFIYFTNYGRDPLLMRALVAMLWALDTLHVALITHAMYFYLILNFANPVVILQPVWSVMTMIMVSNVSNVIVRGIFAYRLWKFSGRNWWYPGIIGVLSMYIFIDGIYFGAKGLKAVSYTDLHSGHFQWSLYAGFSFEVAVDGFITVSQCLLLFNLQTGLKSTDTVLKFMMTYSVNTGLLTSICALLCLITYTAKPDSFIYFFFYFILSKLYANALLANLNARRLISENLGRALRRPGTMPTATRSGKVPISEFSSSGESSSQSTRPQFTTIDANFGMPISDTVISMSDLGVERHASELKPLDKARS